MRSHAERSMRAALAATAAAALLGGAHLSVAARVSPADPGDAGPSIGSYVETAAADGMRVVFAVPNLFIVEQFIDGGGPTAQATLDSVGTSRAFASLPYPGEIGVAAPGLLGIVTGRSLPSYPFIASTSHPSTPDARLDEPGYHLHSHSAASASTATAAFGDDSGNTAKDGNVVSSASVTRSAGGTLVASALTHGGMSLGAATLTGVESSARITRAPGAPVTRASGLSVASLSLGGVAVGVTPQGLVLGGTTAPLDPVQQVTQSLSANGTTVRFLSGSSSDDGVVSPALEITTSQLDAVVGHPVIVSVIVGRASAAVSSSEILLPGLPAMPLTPSTGAPAASAPASAQAAALPPPSITAPASGSAAQGAPSRPGQGLPPSTLAAAPRHVDLPELSLYPVLAAAGAVLLLGALGIRLTRGGSPWSS